MGLFNLSESLRRKTQRFVPGGRNKLAAFLVTNQRRANAVGVIDEWMAEAAFDAEKLAVQSVHVTIASDDPHDFVSARADGKLTPIRAICASGNCLVEFPRSML